VLSHLILYLVFANFLLYSKVSFLGVGMGLDVMDLFLKRELLSILLLFPVWGEDISM
jgi:hypothetical protein